jgi:hypothetical protein
MYWPLGPASVFAVPPTDDNPSLDKPESNLISLSRSTSSSLLATATAEELSIWNTQVLPFVFRSNCITADGHPCVRTAIIPFP